MIHDHGDRPYDWVGAWSERRATLTPDTVGLKDVTTGESYTYADLDERANRAARLLAERGVEKGDRIAVVSRNRIELVDLFFAAGKLGAVLAPLSHRLAPPELGELLDRVDPSVLAVEAPFAEDVATALDGDADAVDDSPAEASGDDPLCPTIRLPAETDAEATTSALDAAPTYADALPADGSPVDGADVALSDPALFLHTGGSTGTPKETVLTHGSICWNSFNTITAWGLRPDDVTPMVFPMFHTGGWNVLTIPLFHIGGTVVIGREVDPERVLRTIEDERASVLVAVPAVLRMMAETDRWEQTDLSALRFVKSGGGPCRDATIRAWRERGVDLSQGYGLTECGPNNFAMPEGWPDEKADTIGKPVLHADVRIVDESGDPVERGEIGELELAGPHAADRYWRDEGETRATFGTPRSDAEADGVAASGSDAENADAAASPSDADSAYGWVSTGDLARVDEDGYYSIEGRKKNMFVSGGENVYPPEIETALTDHPGVDEAVVIGVPDEQWGTVGKAVVQGDESLTLDALREFLDGRLAGFKHPRELAFVDEMPTSGPSKIDRSAIARRFGTDGN
ncbi:fatty-acyl-CoA synthase [Natronoarchaeum philippinense]|uniref:Fatty-acyl-CoA synthase n=1 Tax=Natronoarchaeum philippinense TaxID=558529 RepID=A0A285NBK9_NATPI|nr:AMP-binding protein [Natronoarchaeum philippinense]SNZ06862.1 fatty-acyl-CoA synthase [Natronoarchaeum philippinense]